MFLNETVVDAARSISRQIGVLNLVRRFRRFPRHRRHRRHRRRRRVDSQRRMRETDHVHFTQTQSRLLEIRDVRC